jgi:hypothetical protein
MIKFAKHRSLLLVVIGGVVLVLIGILAIQMRQPKRSIGAFCSVRQEQEAKLKNSVGTTYSSALFPGRHSSDAGDFADAMEKLERVAPDDIVADVRTQRLAFEKVKKDPLQSVSVALSAVSSENNLRTWSEQHCGQTTKD